MAPTDPDRVGDLRRRGPGSIQESRYWPAFVVVSGVVDVVVEASGDVVVAAGAFAVVVGATVESDGLVGAGAGVVDAPVVAGALAGGDGACVVGDAALVDGSAGVRVACRNLHPGGLSRSPQGCPGQHLAQHLLADARTLHEPVQQELKLIVLHDQPLSSATFR